jgi:transposase-like protein
VLGQPCPRRRQCPAGSGEALLLETGGEEPADLPETGVTTAEREELAQLRKENRLLRMERDFAKKAAAFFAKETE